MEGAKYQPNFTNANSRSMSVVYILYALEIMVKYAIRNITLNIVCLLVYINQRPKCMFLYQHHDMMLGLYHHGTIIEQINSEQLGQPLHGLYVINQ